MSDRFYRATQALKVLGNYWETKLLYHNPRRDPLSEEEKEAILELLDQGYTKPAIARRLNLAGSTVYNFERRYNRETGKQERPR